MDGHRWRGFAAWCALVIVVWSVACLVATRLNAKPTIGDIFTSLAALFSGLAFAGVIYALRLQMAELSLQREELQATREELRRTAAAQEATQTAVEQQARIAALAALVEAAAREGGQIGVFANQHTLGTFQAAVRELRELARLPPQE